MVKAWLAVIDIEFEERALPLIRAQITEHNRTHPDLPPLQLITADNELGKTKACWILIPNRTNGRLFPPDEMEVTR